MVRRKSKALHERQEPELKLKCTHYWVIESPHGPTSMGACKLCGAVSEFSNYVPYPSWEGKSTKFPKSSEFSDIEPGEELNNS